jgi:subtilisin family serine protease
MKKFPHSITIFLTALLLFAAGLWAPARGAGLTETGADDPRPYIVVFEQRPVRGLRSLAADPAAQIKDRLQEQTRTTFNLIDGALVDMTPAEAESLAAEPGVAFIEPDYPVYALSQTVPWGVERIYEEETYPFEAWQTTSGAGIGVAILDTGIQGNHEDLPALVGGTSTVDSSNYYEDGNGHGTHVAGIVAAQINAVGVVGTAPGVDLYSVKVLDSGGHGTISSILAGIQWASGEENDIDIISMSLGTMEYSQALKDACDAAYATGLLLFAAAGNNGDQVDKSINYPAAFSSVIAVGATDDSDQRASFSAIGPELELMAPGDSILSTYPNTSLGSQVHLVGEQPDGLYEYDLYSGDLIDSGLGTVTADVIFCGEATDTSVISAALTAGGIAPGEDWIALIDRGDSTFAEKTATVMNLGADAVIIINNDTASPDAPGAFTLDDGATVPPGGAWVPTVSVSYNSGEMIRDAVHLNGTVKVGYDPYKTISGTSMSTPYAAGAAAVIWSLAPELANAEIREILSGTALDLGLPDTEQGSGLIQLNAALDLAEDRASDQVLALSSLQHDASAGVAQADLELRVLPGTQGQVFFALYDAAGRFLACTATPVVTEEYAQALSVSTTYSTVNTAAKAKAFFVAEGIDPLGLSLEIPLP